MNPIDYTGTGLLLPLTKFQTSLALLLSFTFPFNDNESKKYLCHSLTYLWKTVWWRVVWGVMRSNQIMVGTSFCTVHSNELEETIPFHSILLKCRIKEKLVWGPIVKTDGVRFSTLGSARARFYCIQSSLHHFFLYPVIVSRSSSSGVNVIKTSSGTSIGPTHCPMRSSETRKIDITTKTEKVGSTSAVSAIWTQSHISRWMSD